MACGCQNSSTGPLSGSRLRAMDGAELARLGEESLRSHLVDTAMVAHRLYAPFGIDQMEGLMQNRNQVRYPLRLAFRIGNMAPHQFANPEEEGDGFVLNIHPSLEGRAGDLALVVAYFLPLMNFGPLINDDHCLLYGATLNGLPVQDYYRELCRIADFVGAAPREREGLPETA